MPKPGENAEHDQPCTNPGHAGQTYAQCGHTPGPWILNGSTVSGKDLVDGRGDYNESPICTISHSYRNPGVDNANARLIAAAPEILTALYNTVDALLQRSREDGDLDFWNRGGPGFEAIDATRALLAKIEGE